jgi:hypothetical protein
MADDTDLFLSEHAVDELTGISRGTTEHRGTRIERKLSKYELQVRHLRTTGIPFFVNARGRPIVTRAAIEGRRETPEPKQGWQPRLAGTNWPWDANRRRTWPCRLA